MKLTDLEISEPVLRAIIREMLTDIAEISHEIETAEISHREPTILEKSLERDAHPLIAREFDND